MFSNQQLKKLIIPLVIEQILGVLVGMADTIMISSAGEAAVSGVSLVDTINVLFFTIFAALTTGGAVVAAQYIGQKNQKKACSAANQLLMASVLAAIILMVICIVWHSIILKVIFGNIEKEVMWNANRYFVIMAFSLPFLAAYNSAAALFRSMGNSKVSMYSSVVMNLINVSGNALLLYIFHMGVVGVAIPSLISRIVAAVILLYLLTNPKHIIHISKKFTFRFQQDMIKKILYIGVPNSLETSIFQIGKIMVLSMIASYGTASIAANAVGNTVATFQVLAGGAIGTATITVVGQCVGANAYEEAEYYTKKLMKIVYGMMAVINTFVFFTAPFLVSLFHLSAETAEIAVQLLRYHSICCILIWPLSFTMPNALRAASDVRYPMIVAILSMWIFRVGFSHLLGSYFGLGVLGVWIAMTIDWLCRSICFVTRFKSGKWKKIGHV